MNTPPIQFLVITLAGWVNCSQQDVIEYLQEENRVLREHLGGKRLLFTDAQRRRLAILAKRISRQRLSGIGPVVTPDTLVRWYRTLVARKYDGSKAHKTGRPWTLVDIERLIVQMGQGSPCWGYTQIRGAMRNLGHDVGWVLAQNGIEVFQKVAERTMDYRSIRERLGLRSSCGAHESSPELLSDWVHGGRSHASCHSSLLHDRRPVPVPGAPLRD
jgi:hypothetical protein